MNDLWQTEELLFAEIADQLKPLPEFARFAFTNNNLKVLVDSNPETRISILRKETPSPEEILDRWVEQTELLLFCGLNESLDFHDAQDFSSLVEGAKEILDSKMARMFNSMEKPKKLYNLVQILMHIHYLL